MDGMHAVCLPFQCSVSSLSSQQLNGEPTTPPIDPDTNSHHDEAEETEISLLYLTFHL